MSVLCVALVVRSDASLLLNSVLCISWLPWSTHKQLQQQLLDHRNVCAVAGMLRMHGRRCALTFCCFVRMVAVRMAGRFVSFTRTSLYCIAGSATPRTVLCVRGEQSTGRV